MEKIQKNEIFRLEITDINNLGFGVGRYKSMVVFVPNAVSGDVIVAKAIKVASSYAVGRIEEILTPSANRIKPKCSHNGCGGCAYRYVSYEEEKCIKKKYVEAAFKKERLTVTVADVTSDGKTVGYRNKAEYPIAYRDGKYEIGFFAPKSHRVVDCPDCSLQPHIFSEIIKKLKIEFKKRSYSVYDEKSETGLLRHVYLRIGEGTGEVSLTLVVTDDNVPDIETLAKNICNSFPCIVSFSLNINPEKTNVICSEKYVNIRGRNYINDILCGIKLKITPASFYQVNHDMAQILYRKAAELAGLDRTKTVADIYCGIGSIGLSMADKAKRLLGIEIVDSAVQCAKENAKENGILNAVFYTGDASDAKRFFAETVTHEGSFSPDVIILDPPRKGAAPELIDYICNELKIEKAVYISCNPDTLARDARIFNKNGYTIVTVYPFDLFPRTGHVESVVLMSKAQK